MIYPKSHTKKNMKTNEIRTLRTQVSYLLRLAIFNDRPKQNSSTALNIIIIASPSVPFNNGSSHLTPKDNPSNTAIGKKYFLYMTTIIKQNPMFANNTTWGYHQHNS